MIPKRMLDNIDGGIGRLPNDEMRKRMAELVDSWPEADRRVRITPQVVRTQASAIGANLVA